MSSIKLNSITLALTLLALLVFNMCAASPLSEVGFRSSLHAAHANFEEDNLCVQRREAAMAETDDSYNSDEVSPMRPLSAAVTVISRVCSIGLSVVCRHLYYVLLFLYYLF